MGKCANPHSGRVDALSAEDFQELERAVAARRCREDIGFATFEDAASAHGSEPSCPECGLETGVVRDDFAPAGHQRCRRKGCGRRFGSLAGTIFEYSKKDLPTWVGIVRLMCFNVPIEAAAEICRITTGLSGSGSAGCSRPWTAARTVSCCAVASG